jgi:2-polyprenyl-3-methyl-5-hydroxy-6-metoxy-1,4-benzoquinol methylase
MDLDGKRILDVGAGHGNVLIELRDRNVVPYAIEVSGEAVAYLRQHNITAERVDISHETFPYEDSQFDYVICTEVIEHIAYPQYALAEIHRVLKLRGKLFLSTHNSFNLYMRLRYLLGRVPTPDLDVTASGQHLRLMSYKVLLELLRGAGFGTISNRSKLVLLGSVCCGRFEVLTRLLARHFLVVCTKEHC